MLWDVHLEGEGYEERRLAEVQKYRTAFVVRRCPVSPPSSPKDDGGASVRAKGVFAHLTEEERRKKEEDMDAWRNEQFRRRDEERRLRKAEEERKAKEEEKQRKIKEEKQAIEQALSGKAKKLSGYQAFANEQRGQLQKANPTLASKAITKQLNAMWESMHKDRKKSYEDQAKAVRSLRFPPPPSAVQTRPCPSLRFPQPHRGAVQRAQKNKANREAVAAAKKKARAKKQALDKEEKKRAAEQQEEEEPETEWIQCDKCKKWRTIPNTMAALLDDTATTSWSCSMNTWDP